MSGIHAVWAALVVRTQVGCRAPRVLALGANNNRVAPGKDKINAGGGRSSRGEIYRPRIW